MKSKPMMQPVHFPLDISAIVIDLDGTLMHTAPELSEAANRMLRATSLLMGDMGKAKCKPFTGSL